MTEDNIKATEREIRMALLEADVALPVVKSFIESIRERALGQEVSKSMSPGQELVRIVHEELVSLMGSASEGLIDSPGVVRTCFRATLSELRIVK